MFEVKYIPRNEFDRNVGVRLMEQNRENLKINGKIFSHTFATLHEDGRINRHGSVACYIPNKNNAHFMAFEIETKIGCVTTVEKFPC